MPVTNLLYFNCINGGIFLCLYLWHRTQVISRQFTLTINAYFVACFYVPLVSFSKFLLCNVLKVLEKMLLAVLMMFILHFRLLAWSPSGIESVKIFIDEVFQGTAKLVQPGPSKGPLYVLKWDATKLASKAIHQMRVVVQVCNPSSFPVCAMNVQFILIG